MACVTELLTSKPQPGESVSGTEFGTRNPPNNKRKKKLLSQYIQSLEGRRPLERPRRRWEDNIKMDLREVGCGGHRLD
jgi:hypothetical protein